MNDERKPLKRPAAQDVIRKDGPADYTGPSANDRVLYINLGFIKYGTTDKLQGAALFLSIILLFFVCVALILGFWMDSAWAKEAIAWLGTPLLLVIGVAVGRGAPDGSKEKSE